MTSAPDRPPDGIRQLEEQLVAGGDPPLLLRRRVVAGIVVAFLVVIAVYWATNRLFGLTYTLEAEPFRRWVDGFGPAGPLVFIGIMALSVLFAPIPNAPIFMAAGLAWGPVLGTLYCMAGLLLGSTMAFWVARRFGRGHLPRLIGKRNAERVDALVLDIGGRVVFWARMIPAVNFDWVSFVAGMTAIPFRVFITYSALGMLFPTAIAVVAGDGLGRDFRITLAAGGAWVAVVVASAVVFWARRRNGRQGGARNRESRALD